MYEYTRFATRLDMGLGTLSDWCSSPKGKYRMALFQRFLNLIARFIARFRSTRRSMKTVQSGHTTTVSSDEREHSSATRPGELKNIYPLF
jgi:hypothetical protein